VPLIEDWQPTRRLTFHFPPRPVRRLRVVQSASGSLVSWSVNELRIFAGDTELAREPQWRLTAHPNPWEVQMAFDNNPITRWRSWEPLFPGCTSKWISAAWRRPIGWSSTPRRPETGAAPAGRPDPVRRSLGAARRVARGDAAPDTTQPAHLATSEIKWQGIEYLLASPSDFWDKDIRNNPRDWGLTPVAEKNDYRLYRID